MNLVGDDANRLTKKGRMEWTNEEIRYVGALSDARFNRYAVTEPYRARFADRGVLTKSTIGGIRRMCSGNFVHLQQSRLLSEQLGLVTGKWKGMEQGLLRHTQTTNQQTLMAQHKPVLD